MTNEPAFGAFIGLILALGVAYGAWMRFQEPAAMPASPTSGGSPSSILLAALDPAVRGRVPRFSGSPAG